MEERYQPGDEAVEVGEQTTKHRRKNAKLYLKMLVSFAFGGTVFRCTTRFGAGLLLLALFVLSMFIFLDEQKET